MRDGTRRTGRDNWGKPGSRPVACRDTQYYRTLDRAVYAARMLTFRGSPSVAESCKTCGGAHVRNAT